MMILAGCMVLDKSGRTLLVHRNDDHLVQWMIPGGKVEPGEDPKAAALRELKEELGVTAQVTEKLGVGHFDFRGTPCEYHYFAAEITEGEPAIQETKHDQWAYMDIQAQRDDFSKGVKGLIRVLNGKA